MTKTVELYLGSIDGAPLVFPNSAKPVSVKQVVLDASCD